MARPTTVPGVRPRVAVLDYGTGNVHSALRAVERAGAEVELTRDPQAVQEAVQRVPHVPHHQDRVLPLQAQHAQVRVLDAHLLRRGHRLHRHGVGDCRLRLARLAQGRSRQLLARRVVAYGPSAQVLRADALLETFGVVGRAEGGQVVVVGREHGHEGCGCD